MEILNGFLVGLSTGIFITWFPGMLNMQAVATSVRAGQHKAFSFSGGLATVIGAQTALGVLFADLFTRHPAVISGIKSWAIPLFLVLAGIFTWKGYRARAARKAHIERPYKGGPFWRGMVMSMMNILNIPFILAIAGWLIGDGLLSRAFLPRLAYVPGTALGALGVFFLYVLSADWISRHAAYFTRNINFFLGGLFVVLAVIQAIRIA
ncbi:LysE family transporter [Neolewinella persica]|uniref:LysE family transporter n=1 Tax=Neolewinella persica TaxID=70998 RepID=UPI0012F7B251|nr:LysE family transporter [Neolewinella persica]